MLNLSHKKLDVWETDLQLIKEIYQLTSKFPKEELFGITSQLRRASISTVSNLSEGLAREYKAEKKRFLDISRASLVEIDTQLEISIMLHYCAEAELVSINELLNKSFAMTTKLIRNYS